MSAYSISSLLQKQARLSFKLYCESVICCSFLFFHSAYGASFDCSKAKTPVEKTLCLDPRLSTLDERLNRAYQSALQKAGEGDVLVRHQQRAWLGDLQNECSGVQILTCIAQQDTARIVKLNSTPAFSPASITEYKITKASRYLDFTIRMFAEAGHANDNTREGPGRVLVFKKGAATPEQIVVMDNIFVSLDEKGQPLVNSADLYAWQGLINVGDFNFDGHEDFAVQNGNHGSYMGPSYDVYLYSPLINRFELSKPLSNLIEGSLGFFQVDPVRRLLTTFSKDGCCYHKTVHYAVVNNKPVPISREIDDSNKNEVSNERMVNGRWKVATKHTVATKDQ